jgi:valyl-tRNA synthetase
MLQPYPDAAHFETDEEAEQELDWIMEFILGIRQIRGEMDIPPGKPLNVLLQDLSDADRALLDKHELYLRNLARLDTIKALATGEEPPTSATALLGGMKILVPMAGLIDIDAERERLTKRRAKSAVELRKLEAKLGNESFVAKAPEAVVAKERGRQEELQRDLAQFDEQIEKLAELG